MIQPSACASNRCGGVPDLELERLLRGTGPSDLDRCARPPSRARMMIRLRAALRAHLALAVDRTTVLRPSLCGPGAAISPVGPCTFPPRSAVITWPPRALHARHRRAFARRISLLPASSSALRRALLRLYCLSFFHADEGEPQEALRPVAMEPRRGCPDPFAKHARGEQQRAALGTSSGTHSGPRSARSHLHGSPRATVPTKLGRRVSLPLVSPGRSAPLRSGPLLSRPHGLTRSRSRATTLAPRPVRRSSAGPRRSLPPASFISAWLRFGVLASPARAPGSRPRYNAWAPPATGFVIVESADTAARRILTPANVTSAISTTHEPSHRPFADPRTHATLLARRARDVGVASSAIHVSCGAGPSPFVSTKVRAVPPAKNALPSTGRRPSATTHEEEVEQGPSRRAGCRTPDPCRAPSSVNRAAC